MINITSYENASQVRFDIEAKKMFSNNKVELIKLSIKPGEEIEIHKNSFDVIFYVVSGKGDLTIELEKVEVCSNSTVFVNQNSLRGWRNNSENYLELLVVKLFCN
jgi:quercetin dioxygenase-like cupin family protein